MFLSLHFLTLRSDGRKMAINVGQQECSDLLLRGEVRGSLERNREVVQ
jgi:hypothetical protein